MKFRVKHDFRKSQPQWTTDRVRTFGPNNEGFLVEADAANQVAARYNASVLPGERLNPFYLEITLA